MTLFSERMKVRRDKLHLTQEQAAERAGMTLRKYQRLEYDTFKPKLSDAAKVAQALETTTDYLAGNTDDDRPLLREDQLSWLDRVVLRLSKGDTVGAIRIITNEEPSQPSAQSKPQTD